LVPVRDQPDALLALRGRLDGGTDPRHVGLVLFRRARGRAAVPLRDRVHGHRHRALSAALLPSRPHHQALPQAADRLAATSTNLLTLGPGPVRLPDTL